MTTTSATAHSDPSGPLWQPDQDRIASAAVTRFQAWAAERHGAPPTAGTPHCTAGPSTTSTPSARRRRVVRRPLQHPVRTRPRRPRHARRPVVPRRLPQLRRARPARRRPAPRRTRAAPRRRVPGDPPRQLDGAAPPGRRLAAQRARPRRTPLATGSAATSPTSPKPSPPCSPPPPSARSDLLRPRLRRPQRLSTASSRWNPSSCSPSTATATAARSTTRRDTVAELRRDLPTLRAVVHIPAPRHPGPRRRPGMVRPHRRRHRAGLRAGPLSTTRCGSSTPPAPPACPRPSSSPRAASCWSTSSRSACTATSAPRTGSSGTPPPAG